MLDHLVKKALDRDCSGNMLEAHDLYEEITEIMQTTAAAELQADPAIRERHEEYKMRATTIEEDILSKINNARISEYVVLDEGRVNVTYDTVFGRCMGNGVKEALIEEPDTQSSIELQHLIEFIEMMAMKCRNLKYIVLKTKLSPIKSSQQAVVLSDIVKDLDKLNITFKVKYCNNINKSKIVLNNGHIIVSKCGLHFYDDKHVTQNMIGAYNYNFRKCINNEIDYYRCEDLSKVI